MLKNSAERNRAGAHIITGAARRGAANVGALRGPNRPNDAGTGSDGVGGQGKRHGACQLRDEV